MKTRALDHVRTRHDWAANVRSYLPVYHLLLGRGAPEQRTREPAIQAGG
jgi:glycogen synthase